MLCGCTAQPSNNTNNILKTKTYLYSYDYETEPDGELITAYHEEKPSVDLNESRDVVKATVNFRKNTVTYIKMNETYSKGNYECTVKEAYKTVSSDFFYTLVDEQFMTDVCNHNLTYTVNGHLNHMSPDDHFQDLKRIISAATGKAKRINVIMPFLYESRQHKRTKRESLDCALALEELNAMGVSNIVTFDAHDPRVQNAIPLSGFDSFNPPYQFMKALFRAVPDLIPDKDHLMIISPDEGAMHRAVYFSNILGVDMGMFYKRRDYSTIINGKNPIVAHEFLGDDVAGKDVIIVDDMIASGGSMLDVAKQLKERKAGRVFVCTTFGLFTEGFEKFDEYYEKGYINKVITTNLTYLPAELYKKPYFVKADMSKFLALIIDSLNHDITIGAVMNPTDKIHALLEKYARGEQI